MRLNLPKPDQTVITAAEASAKSICAYVVDNPDILDGRQMSADAADDVVMNMACDSPMLDEPDEAYRKQLKAAGIDDDEVEDSTEFENKTEEIFKLVAQALKRCYNARKSRRGSTAKKVVDNLLGDSLNDSPTSYVGRAHARQTTISRLRPGDVTVNPDSGVRRTVRTIQPARVRGYFIIDYAEGNELAGRNWGTDDVWVVPS